MSGEAIWRMFERELRKRALAPMSEEEASQHALDAVRAYVKPGADPRVEWHEDDGSDHTLHSRLPDDPRWFENYSIDAPLMAVGVDAWKAVGWSLRSPRIYRYVPLDVMRWRDPKHREALTERARAYAALQPEAKRC